MTKETSPKITQHDKIVAHIINNGGWIVSRTPMEDVDAAVEVWRVNGKMLVLQHWLDRGGYELFLPSNGTSVEEDKNEISKLITT